VQSAKSAEREEACVLSHLFGTVFPTERFGTGLFGADFHHSKGPVERYCIKNDTNNDKNPEKPFRGQQTGEEIQIDEIVVECFFFRLLSSIMQRAVSSDKKR